MRIFGNMARAMVATFFVCIAGAAIGVTADNCYDVGKVPAERQIFAVSTVLMLDETVVFDTDQRDHIREHAAKLLAFGNELRVFTFSAFRDGRYTLPVMDVRLAKTLDESMRNTLRKDSMRAFDTCQQVSMNRAKKQLESILETYFERSSNKLANSDICGTLKEIGDAVFPTLRSKSRRLVLVSDMLENSGISSFYGTGGAPRVIDVATEFSKVEKQSLLSDLRGTSVYVIGAGVAPATGKSPASTYRSQPVMAPLKAFWTLYFEKSNAKMAEFGQPLLLAPIGGQK